MNMINNKLFIFIISLILVALGTESFLRIFWKNPYMNVPASKIIELHLHSPNQRLKLDRSWLDTEQSFVNLETNADSFLQPSNQHSSPEYTIAFMGGSTTECSYVLPDLRFPALVSKQISDMGILVNTINLGHSGATLHDNLNNYINHLCLYEHDYVVVMHATNDRGVLRKDPSYESRMGHHVGLPHLAKYSLQLLSKFSSTGFVRDRITRFLNKRNLQKQKFSTTIPLKSETNFHAFRIRLQSFISVVRNFGKEPILMTQPLSEMTSEISPNWINSSDQKVLNEIIREIAGLNNVILIDLKNYLYDNEQFIANPQSFLYDGMHVTDLGSMFYADKISNIIFESLLDKKKILHKN
jgi:hypothetical protein